MILPPDNEVMAFEKDVSFTEAQHKMLPKTLGTICLEETIYDNESLSKNDALENSYSQDNLNAITNENISECVHYDDPSYKKGDTDEESLRSDTENPRKKATTQKKQRRSNMGL